jgi:hypothetical protein
MSAAGSERSGQAALSVIAGSGTPRGKENAAAHDLQRTTSRLMQSGVAGLPNARFALSADRIADALTLRPPALRGGRLQSRG